MIYAFGNYKLDALNYELYDHDQLTKLSPRAFEVLIYLIENRDHVVSRDELTTNLWPGQIVSDVAINNCIKRARKAIGDSGDGQHKIRTVHGRGYRFVAKALEQRSEPPMFREPSIEHGRMLTSSTDSSIEPVATSQNVFADDYASMTVLCGALETISTAIDHIEFESVQRLRQEFFVMAQEEANRQEAMFQFFGPDGFLMYFGLPVDHPDQLKRAILTGLRLQNGIRRALSSHGMTVQLGVHTGLHKIKSAGNRREWDVPTESAVTALAIRLQFLATADEFLASQSIVSHAAEIIHCVEHSELPMPGRIQPMRVYRIRCLVVGKEE